jgi:hypothetical protein
MKKNTKKVDLILRTWTSDIAGIYDYSTKAFKLIKDSIGESTYVVRFKNNEFDNISEHSKIPPESDLLFYVNNGNTDKFSLINLIPKKLKLTNENISYLNNKIWYVIKSEESEDKFCNEEYYICQNDIIKLGKNKFVVQKIHKENNFNGVDPPMPINQIKNYDLSKLNQNTPPIFDFIFEVIHFKIINDKNENINNETPQGNEGSENMEVKCAICNQSNYDSDNFEINDYESNILISLCKCKEKRMLHLECLRKQLKVSIEKKKLDKSITIENCQCPSCNEQYPLKFRLNNEMKTLIRQYEEPKSGDFIILESLDYIKDDKYCKSIHIITLERDYITIGRDSENDVVEKDISISRFHASLKFNKENGKICLKNISKKFRTLVLVKAPIILLENKIYLQVGRTFIEACLVNKNNKNNKDKIEKENN